MPLPAQSPAPQELQGLDPLTHPEVEGSDPAEQYDPLDPYEVADRARHLVDYTVKMPAEERRVLGMRIREEIERYLSDTADRRSSVEQWRRDWKVLPVPPSGRWEGSAQLNSPFTQIYCKSHATKLNNQLTTDPVLAVVARTPDAVDQAPHIEEALTASLEEASWQRKAAAAFDDLPIVGNCFVKLMYEEEYRRRPDIKCDWNRDTYLALIRSGMNPREAFALAVNKDAKGDPKVFLEWVNEPKSSGPAYKIIPWEDGIIVPTTIQDPKDARGIGERVTIRGSELKAKKKEGIFFADAVDYVLTHASDLLPEERVERLDQQGIDVSNTEPADMEANWRSYDCWELCWRGDFNADDEEEWAIVTIHHDTGTILRLQYLPYEHGEAYYSMLRYIVVNGDLFGMSIAELVATLQDAHTAWLNQTIDAIDLALNMRGNFFYDASSGLKPDKWTFQLGKPIPVDNAQGIVPMTPPALTPDHWQTHQVLKDLADLMTATSNPSLGQVTDTNKTLGEVQLVSAASNMIFEEIAAGVALQCAEIWDQHRWLLAQYGDRGQVRYRKSAMPGRMIDVPPSPEEKAAQEAQGMLQGAIGGLDPNAGAMGPNGAQIGPNGAPGAPPAPGMPPAAAGLLNTPLNGAPGPQVPAAMVQGQLVPAPNGYAFGTISSAVLASEVDIIPTGLKQMGDQQSRIQQAVMVLNTLVQNPVTMSNVPALIIALDFFLQAARFPQRAKVMDEVYKAYYAQMAAMQLQAQASAAAGQVEGGEAARGANAADDQAAQAQQTAQLQNQGAQLQNDGAALANTQAQQTAMDQQRKLEAL